jgi:hypothetical protein
VLAIATESNRSAFHSALAQLIDADAAIAESRLTMLDARETLAEFMVDGHPDRQRFDATVGELVRRALGHGRGLCAFGEMVALLWEDGAPEAAIELERLWNGLQDRHDFSLLCAYPAWMVGGGADPQGYFAVGAVHTSIVSGPPVAADAEVVGHFPAHFGSPRLVRNFVRSTLEEWRLEELSDSATLIATELATNAIRHAGSDFAVSLARSPHGVRLAVGDTTADMPIPREAAESGSGRGLHLIAATAREWGHHCLDNGKLVWAEIERPAGLQAI